MLKGKMVRVRMKRHFPDQKLWVFVGKVEDENTELLLLNCKGILVLGLSDQRNTQSAHLSAQGQMTGRAPSIETDREVRPIAVPLENVANIRVLPDDFSLDKFEVVTEGRRIGIKVEGAPDTWIGEHGES